MTEAYGFLLVKYFNSGWLNRRYFDGNRYWQPYSAADRLRGGKLFYNDFMAWKKGAKLIRDYEAIKVDVSLTGGEKISCSKAAERFRQALRTLSKTTLPVVYKIVLCEEEISAPKSLSEREKLYFNLEVKNLLCRGLDELASFYVRTIF